jgi:uncharacterized phage infection (PIP) family protein YhgE
MSSKSKAKMRTRTNLASADLITLLKRLAQEHHSTALTQLASRVSAVLKFGAAGGDDVFAKVKGLIQDMIDRLLKEAAAEATEKAFCDDEMAKTEEKKGDLEADIAKLTSKIDLAAARSAKLKEEVKTLQEELAALAKLQAEMDKTRQEENAAFIQAKADLEQGLAGVQSRSPFFSSVLAISSSQNAFSVASAAASFKSLSIMSWISPFTFANTSSPPAAPNLRTAETREASCVKAVE